MLYINLLKFNIMKNHPFSNGRTKVSFILFLLSITLIMNCKPPKQASSDEEDQCADFNIFYTAAVDLQYTGNCSAIDDIVNAYLENENAPHGCAVGIVVNNGIYYLKGYGKADLGTNRNFTYATPSPVGSISKTLTALGILKLVEGGYIDDLDDQASLYLPEGIPTDEMTIHELLGHGSGLPYFPDWYNFLNEEEELADISDDGHPGANHLVTIECYRTNATTPLASGQGAYSNTGYTVLGAIIDHITNNQIPTIPAYSGPEGYEQYLYEVIGEDANMYSMCLNTYWRDDDILNLATGYRENSNIEFTAADNIDPDGGPGGWRGPAGGWTLNVGDLCRMMIAMNTNDIVDESLMDEMTTASYSLIDHDDLTPWGINYGLGVMRSGTFSNPSIIHYGNIDGYTARYIYWPERGLGVAILTNEQYARGLRELTRDIASLFSGIDLPCMAIAHHSIESENIEYLNTIRTIASKNNSEYSTVINRWFNGLTKEQNGQIMMKALIDGDVEKFSDLTNSILSKKRKNAEEDESIAKKYESLNEIR